MASQIYIIHEDSRSGAVEYYEFTATSSIEISKRNNVTDVPVEQGFSVTDNSFSEPVRFSLKGVLSNIQNYSLDFYRSPEESIKAFHQLMDNGDTFTFVVDEGLESYDNTIIESINLLKSSGMGKSWTIDATFKQIIITNKARNVTFPPQEPETQKQARAKTKQGDNSTEEKRIQTSLLVTQGINVYDSAFFAQSVGAFSKSITENDGG